jgi:hypothetical protein
MSGQQYHIVLKSLSGAHKGDYSREARGDQNRRRRSSLAAAGQSGYAVRVEDRAARRTPGVGLRQRDE